MTRWILVAALVAGCGVPTDKDSKKSGGTTVVITQDCEDGSCETDNNGQVAPESCGDGILVAGEVCDGDCPTSCDDSNACTTDAMSGKAELCNVVCINEPVTACANDDGCCAPGCTPDNDNDCTCTPTSCDAAGAACGSVPDGCGGTLDCGGCGSGQACDANQCVTRAVGNVGDACVSDDQCPDLCLQTGDFPDGFCSSICEDDFDCEQGNHCVALPGYAQNICMPNCQADNDCQDSNYACRDSDGDGDDECAPAPVGNSPPGGACEGVQDCHWYSDFCAGPNDSFPNGFCTTECFFNGMCPPDTVCLTDPGICVPECDSDADCRADEGYACEIATNDITGEEQGLCL